MRNFMIKRHFMIFALMCGLCYPPWALTGESFRFSQKISNPVTKALKILRVTPSGNNVTYVQQIVFTFNQAVVPLGKMERDNVPVSITPAINCQWRWLNTSSLACQLKYSDYDLTPATRFHITMFPGITTESNKTLDDPYYHTFVTERPKIKSSRLKTWRAPGLPKVKISFNQEVRSESVKQHLYFKTNENARIPIRLEKYYSNHWIVSPIQLLPLDTQAELVVEPGIQSLKHGAELGIESRTVYKLHTFPVFKFLGVECDTLKGESVFIDSQDRLTNVNRRCDPVNNVYLRFSSPVIKEAIQNHLLITPDLAKGNTNYNPWQYISNSSNLDSAHKKHKSYYQRLPIDLKPYQTYQLKGDTLALTDMFGRTLSEPIDLSFLTDHFAPTYHFNHPISVLEKGVDSELPIVLINLEEITFNYHLLTPQGWSSQKQKTVSVPKAADVIFRRPLGIRDLIAKPSGMVQGYFTTKPTIDNDSDASTANHFISQVTPYYVQTKIGHYNTLVWVTDFATGLPVAGVDVSIYLGTIDTVSKSLAESVTNAEGIALLPGTQTLDPKLDYSRVYSQKSLKLFVHCQKGQDMALLPLSYDYRLSISPYSSREKKYGHIRTWGTTAQGVYKVGDTIQYKFFVRDQSNQAFIQPPKDGYHLTVKDPMGKVAYEVKDLSLSEFGTYDGEFRLPENAAVGWYNFKLSSQHGRWYPLRVLVSDFTPSPFRVRTELEGDLFHIGDKVTVNTSAMLHAGGPYVDAETRITASITRSYFSTMDFTFDLYTHYSETVFSNDEKIINDKGLLQTTFTLPTTSDILYGKLRVESAVSDDRGKRIAHSTTATYVGRDRFVGLKETSWLLSSNEEAKILSLVVDEHRNPVAGTEVDITIEYLLRKASRVKGAGNAYLTRYTYDWVEAATCHQTSTLKGVPCTFIPSKAGDYKITATIQDTHNRSHTTVLRQWATGSGYVMWDTDEGNTLDIVPEQDNYKVGDTARYMVKNPYPGAQALITIERFGTLKSWVHTLKDSISVIEVPIEADYVPGFYLSVTIMSPRVEKPIDQNQVDLGKPDFRMGYVETNIRDPYKEVVVDIKSNKTSYKPGEEVTLDLHAIPRHPTHEPIELAITVLDESVFDLLSQGLGYFDLYKGFYTLNDLDMTNYNLLKYLVGRIKFEKKGANAGGDGGGDGSSSIASSNPRSVFKFVSYWNPSLKTDSDGKAQVKFKIPDNLTGWRVLVMATTPTDRMGLSDAHFKVNKPIEIRPALPNQVLMGDIFKAGFTVMNRTDKVRDLKVSLKAEGPPIKSVEKHSSLLNTKPYKRYPQWLEIATTRPGIIELTVTASDAEEGDSLRQTVRVYPRRASTTVATFGTTIANTITESIHIPKDIHEDVGSISVITSPTVIGGVERSFEYMRDYPYACWEQKLSKGTMASHYHQLQAYISKDFEWEDSETLADKTLALATEYQAPNGGMAYFIAENERVSPYLSAYTALAFNWLRANGHTIPELVEKKLHAYLLILLRKNVIPSYYSKGMASSVRAVALAALAKHGKITIDDIHRYKLHLSEMDLFGLSQFLAAALEIPGTEDIRVDVLYMIMSHADQSATDRIAFVEKLDDGYQHLLSSSLRTQCSILSSLNGKIEGVPFKLVRNIRKALSKTWLNTQENLFCMNALIEYARIYEKDQPVMTVRSWLDAEKFGETSFEAISNPPVTFSHALPAPDSKATIKLEREGTGRLYYTVRMKYAEKIESATAINAGIEVKREYHVERDDQWILLTSPMHIKRGELVRVDLYLSLPAPRYFVVVNDPVPGGLEPVNRDLATTSKVDADKASGQYSGGSLWFGFDDWEEYGESWWSFYHQELRHHAATFYADYLSAGHYHLSYIAQAIAPGEFSVMATHAEEMYDPEVFGKGKPAILKVK